MQKGKDNDFSGKPLVIAILLSLIAGFLISFWAISLDPKGTGGSILMLPVISILILLTIALFVTGLISFKSSFGKYLVGASLLIPIIFFILKEFLLSAIK